jgi:hypothetical protein
LVLAASEAAIVAATLRVGSQFSAVRAFKRAIADEVADTTIVSINTAGGRGQGQEHSTDGSNREGSEERFHSGLIGCLIRRVVVYDFVETELMGPVFICLRDSGIQGLLR